MKWTTHIISSYMLYLILLKLLGNPLVLRLSEPEIEVSLLILIGAIFPDLIEMLFLLPHRSRIFHEFMLYIFLLSLSFLVFQSTILRIVSGFALYHLILDSITKRGVFFFGMQVSGPLNSEGKISNLTVILVHVFATLYLIK